MAPAVTTVGHGTLAADEFSDLVRDAGIDHVVDVRSYPGSRRHPHFGREAMAEWLPAAGVDYSWLRELGGRRPPVRDSVHTALRNEGFRAYADHMGSDEFRSGVSDLLRLATNQPLAVMCSESVWWRCHRRLLSDHLVLIEQVPVKHLFHDGRLADHSVTDGARRADGHVLYDSGEPPLPMS